MMKKQSLGPEIHMYQYMVDELEGRYVHPVFPPYFSYLICFLLLFLKKLDN